MTNGTLCVAGFFFFAVNASSSRNGVDSGSNAVSSEVPNNIKEGGEAPRNQQQQQQPQAPRSKSQKSTSKRAPGAGDKSAAAAASAANEQPQQPAMVNGTSA